MFKLVNKSEISKFGEFAIGACLREYNLIIFDENFIKTANPIAIQEVFDHEVGHCLLGRVHNNSIRLFKNKVIDSSIMNSKTKLANSKEDEKIYEAQYKINTYKNKELKKIYRKELFNLKKINEYKKQL